MWTSLILKSCREQASERIDKMMNRRREIRSRWSKIYEERVSYEWIEPTVEMIIRELRYYVITFLGGGEMSREKWEATVAGLNPDHKEWPNDAILWAKSHIKELEAFKRTVEEKTLGLYGGHGPLQAISRLREENARLREAVEWALSNDVTKCLTFTEMQAERKRLKEELVQKNNTIEKLLLMIKDERK